MRIILKNSMLLMFALLTVSVACSKKEVSKVDRFVGKYKSEPDKISGDVVIVTLTKIDNNSVKVTSNTKKDELTLKIEGDVLKGSAIESTIGKNVTHKLTLNGNKLTVESTIEGQKEPSIIKFTKI